MGRASVDIHQLPDGLGGSCCSSSAFISVPALTQQQSATAAASAGQLESSAAGCQLSDYSWEWLRMGGRASLSLTLLTTSGFDHLP